MSANPPTNAPSTPPTPVGTLTGFALPPGVLVALVSDPKLSGHALALTRGADGASIGWVCGSEGEGVWTRLEVLDNSDLGAALAGLVRQCALDEYLSG